MFDRVDRRVVGCSHAAAHAACSERARACSSVLDAHERGGAAGGAHSGVAHSGTQRAPCRHGAWGTGGWRAHVVEAARRIPMPREFAAAAGRAGMTGVGQAEAVWRRLCLQLEQGMEDGWVEAAVQEVQAAVVRDGDRAWHAAKPRLEEEVLSPPHLSFPLSSLPSSILPT